MIYSCQIQLDPKITHSSKKATEPWVQSPELPSLLSGFWMTVCMRGRAGGSWETEGFHSSPREPHRPRAKGPHGYEWRVMVVVG